MNKPLPIPNQCIWCLSRGPDVIFDESHIVPKCVGNFKEQVLPRGIVCRCCNGYFGTSVEPALLRDPSFHTIAVVLRLRHPDRMNEFRDNVFDGEHPSTVPIEKEVHLDTQLTPTGLTMGVSYGVKGCLSKEYEIKELGFLSRAVHKIAYESLAWFIFVKGTDEKIDIFDSSFDYIRRWSRYGEPQNSVRPVLRMQYVKPDVRPKWQMRHWRANDWLGVELDLFGDWYGVSLTSPPDDAFEHLRKRANPSDSTHTTWFLSTTLTEVKGTI